MFNRKESGANSVESEHGVNGVETENLRRYWCLTGKLARQTAFNRKNSGLYGV